MQNYHRMYIVSQERYDKLVNLQSSGGAQSIKDEAENLAQQEFVHKPSARRNISRTSTGTETESESNVEGTGVDPGFWSGGPAEF